MRSLWAMLSNCTDPARDAEYNRWYDTMHIPDLTATPGILAGQRYKNIRQKPAKDEPLYLALYTVEADDPWALLRQVAWVDDKRRAEQGRMIDCLQARLLSAWATIGPVRFAAGRSGKATLDKDVPEHLMLILANAHDRSQDGHFNRWLDGIYLPALLKLDGVSWGQGYRTMRPSLKQGDCTNLVVLALDSKDPASLLDKVDKASKANASQMRVGFFSAFKYLGGRSR